jgi:hypothetical protein
MRYMKEWGFDVRGIPIVQENFQNICKSEKIPYSIAKHSYFESIVEAFPEFSKTHINRLFKDHSVTAYKYECLPQETPQELFGGSCYFAVIKCGKKPVVLFK